MRAFLFILGHTLFNTFAHICFKLSVYFGGLSAFVFWQAIGNGAAFIGVLSYTMAMRTLPLHVAFPLTQGLSVVGVTLVAGRLLFHESVSSTQWLGVILVAGGIALISVPQEKLPLVRKQAAGESV